MDYRKMTLTLIFLLLFAGNTLAATLSVIRQGTGNGEVQDMKEEGIACGGDCL